MSASERDDDPAGGGTRARDVQEHDVTVNDSPDLTEKESQELIHRIGRGVRAMVGDVLLDPLPTSFKHLLEKLEGSEKGRRRA